MTNMVHGTVLDAKGHPTTLVPLDFSMKQSTGQGSLKGLINTTLTLTNPHYQKDEHGHIFLIIEFTHPTYCSLTEENWANYLHYLIYTHDEKRLSTYLPPDISQYVYITEGINAGRYLFQFQGTGGSHTNKIITVDHQNSLLDPAEAITLDQFTVFDRKDQENVYINDVGFHDRFIIFHENIQGHTLSEQKRYGIQFTKQSKLESMLNFCLGITYPFFSPDKFNTHISDDQQENQNKLRIVKVTPEFWYLEPFDRSFKLILNDSGFQDAITAVKDHICDQDNAQTKYDDFNAQLGQLLTRDTHREDILKLCVDYLEKSTI